MSVARRRVRFLAGGGALFSLLLCWGPAQGGGAPEAVAGLPAAEALRLGEAMYRNGVLPSGRPMVGVVQGDIEMTGEMSTCSSCHMRSGMGSMEGGILTPPTGGSKLYAPLARQQDIPGPLVNRSMFKSPPRPTYDDASLAAALVYGIDPTGRTLRETMPRYRLTQKETEILVFYLKQLSAKPSPGVDGETVRFATIVTDQVSAADRDALLLPLKAFLQEEWNDRLMVLGSQWNSRWYGPDAVKAGSAPRLRRAVLDVWELKGPESGWGEQLEALYRKAPVFAVLGGVSRSWGAAHRFCEEKGLPAVLPTTELPAVAHNSWYTLYFSKGVYQEGETAAKYLSRVFELPQDKKVVQVFRDNDTGRALARGFADTWQQLGKAALSERKLLPGEKTGGAFWKKLCAQEPGAALVLWLAPEDLAGIAELPAVPGHPSTLFFSATLLGPALGVIPEPLRDFSFITYPNRLPGDEAYSKSLLSNWMKLKKIPETNLFISSDVYFLTRLLSRTLLDMGTDLHRDFFLDLLDGAPDQANSSLRYPRLSFGPGQRYASKGCFVVALGKGENPKLVRKSDWVIY
ncbi:ABC transporter substrate-binding protein [Citrifermentans bremense]|uniref:ABC transporter substrate-binding protein n=1 Tax=Citrifermentans bremense TaxID=60035 RepID=UPI00042A2A0C|nr:ABC transporter substrate-binding protein [Citrifermentans bremense]